MPLPKMISFTIKTEPLKKIFTSVKSFLAPLHNSANVAVAEVYLVQLVGEVPSQYFLHVSTARRYWVNNLLTDIRL